MTFIAQYSVNSSEVQQKIIHANSPGDALIELHVAIQYKNKVVPDGYTITSFKQRGFRELQIPPQNPWAHTLLSSIKKPFYYGYLSAWIEECIENKTKFPGDFGLITKGKFISQALANKYRQTVLAEG